MYGRKEGKIVMAYLSFLGYSKWQTIHYRGNSAVWPNIDHWKYAAYILGFWECNNQINLFGNPVNKVFFHENHLEICTGWGRGGGSPWVQNYL